MCVCVHKGGGDCRGRRGVSVCVFSVFESTYVCLCMRACAKADLREEVTAEDAEVCLCVCFSVFESAYVCVRVCVGRPSG